MASSMLDEMLAFSSQKQPKHLKRVVIILYPGDTQTIQVREEGKETKQEEEEGNQKQALFCLTQSYIFFIVRCGCLVG